jgi:hypothetical protein
MATLHFQSVALIDVCLPNRREQTLIHIDRGNIVQLQRGQVFRVVTPPKNALAIVQ